MPLSHSAPNIMMLFETEVSICFAAQPQELLLPRSWHRL